jgi:hypothetical protein
MHDRTEKTPDAAGSDMKWKRIVPHLFLWMSFAVVWATFIFSELWDGDQLDIMHGLLLAVFGIGLANYFKIGLLTDG